MLVEDVPAPKVQPGCALVRVRHSLISSGTESGFVASGGTAGLALKKARDPLNVEKVKRKLATVGIKGTIDIVRDKLLQFQAPGYSTAGVIVDVADDVPGFRVGDRVACAGVGYASHAEFNVVPHNLLTPIPDGVDFEEAAFVTLGAIAMQGVRQAAPTFGETIVVLGLGLLGQLAAQMVRAAGCHVIGCDPIAEKRELALSLGADAACGPGELPDAVAEWTAGHGADAVVVCAASKESKVTVQALEMCRQKGRVAIVGAVGMDLPREPLYMKELDFRLSCSYGPGRYQPNYEERGLDYPIGYVRWTEGRNMAAFLRMIADQRVRVRELVTTVKPVAEAKAAYDSILGGDPKAVAALIAYPGDDCAPPARYALTLTSKAAKRGDVRVGVIGAGGFASAYHLPNLAAMRGVSLRTVAARTGKTAKQTGDKFGAAYCTTDYQEILDDKDIDAVVIATRHNLHAEMALAAARAGKHIFVEKPLALEIDECEAIVKAVEDAGVLLTVGFNRRFSPFAEAMKAALDRAGGPKNILYRCNAGALPLNHWAQDPVEGGGRIVGECVHFYDLCCWLAGEDATSVKASRLASGREDIIDADNLATVLTFPNGSLATIVYACTGHGGLGKERVEGFAGGGAVVIDDFRGVQFHGLPGKNVSGSKEQKGQAAILTNFIAAIRGEAALSVTATDGLRATRIARQALASAQGG